MLCDAPLSRRRYRPAWVLTTFFVVNLLVGCATRIAPEAPTPGACNKKHDGSAADDVCLIRITPLSSLVTGFSDPDENFSNLYTRILVNARGTRGREIVSDGGRPVEQVEQAAVYEYRDRGPFLRAVWGTHYSINLTAYISVGNYQATIPLVTIDHTSNRNDGEKFIRVVAHTVQNFPLLLVKGDGSNAVATVKFVVKASDDPQSRIASLAIQAAEAVAKAVAPESAVVTTLNAQGSKDKAAALDSAINSLMSRQLDEEQLIDNDIRRWANGALINFQIPAPTDESNWRGGFQAVGSWRVQFEDPRPSVFSDIQICYSHTASDERPVVAANKKNYCLPTVMEAIKEAQAEAARRPEQVLAFNLVNASQSLGSVGSYLKQQAWWDTSMKTFSGLKKGEAPQSDDIASFCRSIKDSIASIGLNAIDAGIVVAAVRERSQLSGPVTVAMKTSEDCMYGDAHP
jgi:hypothetical protein